MSIFNNVKVEDYYKSIVNDDVLYKNYTEMIADNLMYIVLIFNIITILFFTIIIKIEKEITKKQLLNVFNKYSIFKNVKIDNIDSIKIDGKSINTYLNNNNNKSVKNKSHTSDVDIEIENNNRKVIRSTFKLLVIVNIITLISLFILYIISPYDLLSFIFKNSVNSFILLLIEILFVYIITVNYIYIDENFLIKYIIQKNI